MVRAASTRRTTSASPGTATSPQHGWTCIGWPEEYGGRGLPLFQQVIFHEEYARANAPARVNHLGEELLGPTLIAFGTEEQKQRFLPRIVAVEELWCQGYSEPGAGSDLANVSTKARLDGDHYVIDGQKVWTSLAHVADWCFVVARTEPGSQRHRGLSYLLVPMDQEGVEVRPINQLTGTSEFNEVFFTGATTDAATSSATRATAGRSPWPRSASSAAISTIGQQVGFQRELDALLEVARANGTFDDPVIRDRLAQAQVELEVIRLNALRTLSEDQAPQQASISKLLWAGWHRTLGELAMQVRGADSLTTGPDYDLDEWQRLFLFTRADTIYGGSDEIQRNVLAERVLGLPREVRPMTATRPEQPTPGYVPAHDLLRDKVVVVTAAAGAGIGAAVARRVLEEGARAVVLGDTHERRLAEAEQSLGEEFGADRVRSLVCDVTDEEQVQALIDAADEFGGVEVMINNAGLGGTAVVTEMTDDQWGKVIDITLTGTFRCIRAASNKMIEAGTRGVIVNNASVIGWRAQEGQAHYAAAKAGVMALTRCAALDVAPHGIRVNAVSPSLAMHPFLAKVTSDELLAELKQREAFGRAAEPWEVANVMVFLASDYSSYLTGEVISVSSQHA